MAAKRGVRRVVFGIGGMLIAVAGTAGTASAQSVATGDQYSGRAYAVDLTGVKLLGTVVVPHTVLGDTGPLPIGGGTVTGGLGTLTLPTIGGHPLGSANVLTDQASGISDTSSASSKIATVTIAPGLITGGKDLIDATVLTANTSVTCAGTGAQTVSTSVASLSIGGQTVTVPAGVNQTVTVPRVATVTFNQQPPYNAGTNQQTANALVITFLAPFATTVAAGTITISHAESDLQCPPFTVSKTANGAGSATVTPGSDVTYGVTLTNQVDTACTLNSVSDSLPPQPGEGGVPFTYVSGGPTGGTAGQSTTSGGQNVVTWTFASPPSIAAGGTFSFDFVAHVPSNEPPGTYKNMAQYTSTCGAGSGTADTNLTSGGLAPVTVLSAILPVPSAGSGLPTLTLPLGLGILGAVLTAGGIVDVIGRRRTARGTPPIE